jgi:pyruvate formate lyase activating enzyme
MYHPEKCVGCGLCVKVCAQHANSMQNGLHIFNRENCNICGNCADVCPERAFEIAGYDLEIHELLKKIERDKAFYEETTGGVTFSGGEPFAQYDGLLEITRLCKAESIHTAVETSLLTTREKIEQIYENIDLWICDMKAYSSELHEKGTRRKNDRILRNLQYLLERDASKVWVRIPLIPNFNDLDSEFISMAVFLQPYEILRVEIMPCHTTGDSKYMALGKDYDALEVPTEDRVKHFCQILEENGVKNVTFE